MINYKDPKTQKKAATKEWKISTLFMDSIHSIAAILVQSHRQANGAQRARLLAQRHMQDGR